MLSWICHQRAFGLVLFEVCTFSDAVQWVGIESAHPDLRPTAFFPLSHITPSMLAPKGAWLRKTAKCRAIGIGKAQMIFIDPKFKPWSCESSAVSASFSGNFLIPTSSLGHLGDP